LAIEKVFFCLLLITLLVTTAMGRHMKRLVGRAFLFLLGTLFYCEFFVYYLVLWQCSYPSTPSSSTSMRAMVLADTHLLGSRNGHWFDKLRREWQMHRAFQTAQTYFSPQHIFFLGDLFDEGLWCPPAEFDYYVKRFHSLFPSGKETRKHVLPGNHDMGFHYALSPYLDKRFKTAFKTKAVQLKVINQVPFVMINSMAFEGDDCFLCKPAVKAVNELKEKLDGLPPPILLSHFPLYRKSDALCSEPDEAPPHEKDALFRERWECISSKSSRLLLNQIKPKLVLSGHTHHGCNTSHGSGVTEISISSFSWRNKVNPAFLLATFDSSGDYKVKKCYMPDEDNVINAYIGSFILFCVSLVIF